MKVILNIADLANYGYHVSCVQTSIANDYKACVYRRGSLPAVLVRRTKSGWSTREDTRHDR